MSDTPSSTGKSGLLRHYDEFRHRLRECLPLKRKHYTKLVARVEEQFALIERRINAADTQIAELNSRADAAIDCLLSLPSLAASAPMEVKIPFPVQETDELCLFASFAPQSALRPHIYDHIAAFRRQGIDVILVVNTSHRATFELEKETAAALSGCMVRENCGFDFAAWAHVYLALNVYPRRRLYLVNDSIVGPLDEGRFTAMIARIRSSTADALGLTENRQPQPHLQSYFLVLGERLLKSDTFDRLMHSVVNMPTKDGVIAQYETQLTRFLRAKGFHCEALFPRIAHAEADKFSSNDTINHWSRLIELGFPYVKTEVLSRMTRSSEISGLIPKQYFEWFPQ